MSALSPAMITFPVERAVFLKEENSKLYSTMAYFVGKSSVEIPFMILLPLVQQLIIYWMVGMNDSR
jgi:ABC-type multidrug transport system permease subunit